MPVRLPVSPIGSPIAAVLLCSLLSGCAHNTYSVTSLPRQYVARPVSDFSTLDLTAWARPAPSENTIRGGDRLEVTLNSGIGGEEAEEVWKVGVDEDGETTLPNIGSIRLAGLTTAQAQQTIVQESIGRKVYLRPAVDLKVEERRLNTIVVAGGVQAPGTLQFPEGHLTLADVLVRSGGLSPSASGVVTINHASSRQLDGDQLHTISESSVTSPGTESSIQVDLKTTSAAQLAAIEIPPGSTVSVVATPGRTIRVIGVINDRILDVPAGRNIRLLDALAMAGGPVYSHWISDRVDIIRRVPGRDETIRIRTSIRRAKKTDEQNLLLAADDIVSVEENPATFTLSTLGGLAGLTNLARVGTP